MKTLAAYALAACTAWLALLATHPQALAADKWNNEAVETIVTDLMDEGNIPGLSLVIIEGNQTIIKNFGLANPASGIAVTDETLFEIGSCTKSFTALAVHQLALQQKIDLDQTVAHYVPWFKLNFEGQYAPITVRQLLHHTSGIPWNSIANIPQTNAENAVELTVRTLLGRQLSHKPGTQYQYATINYDVLALIIETVTGQRFEAHLQQAVIAQLGMSNTSVGVPILASKMAQGHKISFFSARPYEAPVYRGNYAAGYVITNAQDMARYMRFQLGVETNPLSPAARQSHVRDESVPLHGMTFYASGWEALLDGSSQLFHGGLNPNFTAYMALRPNSNTAVAVLANSNSMFTSLIGHQVLQTVNGETVENSFDPGDNGDRTYSSLAIALVVFCMIVLAFITMVMLDVIKGRRKFEGPTLSKLRRILVTLAVVAPCVYGLYILPKAMAGFTWEAVLVWTPDSFYTLIVLVLVAIGITFVAWFLSLSFPQTDQFRRVAPQILLMSVLSGLANSTVIIMVTSALNSNMELQYSIFYYVIALIIYLSGRKFVQTAVVRFNRNLILDLRIKLTEKIFSTSYHNFERMDRGRVYTALNDDVSTIGGSTNTIVMLMTGIITVIGAFIFLASLAFWATLLTIFMIVAIAAVYSVVGQKANPYFESARDARNVFMRLVNGMIDGYKEISMSRNKKLEYRDDVTESAYEHNKKISTADIKFVNAFLVGESLLVVLLGIVAYGVPELFPNIEFYTLMSFVIILLYLIGPINGILGSIPTIVQVRVAWNRIQEFLADIPVSLDLNDKPEETSNTIDGIELNNVTYTYKSQEDDSKNFGVGPINLDIGKGQILFIIGGNGSGKTTLAKLITGLYEPDQGEVRINGQVVNNFQLGECFSAVFSPTYLFEKLYNIDADSKQAEIAKYLKLLHLDKKVEINNNKYSTIELSGGQRKRLALLQCYLEDSPIYLFDEWAADQDPSYRKFFYRTLLPEMRAKGKIVIAITHDDHYFDVADKIMKMDQGQLKPLQEQLAEEPLV